MQFEKLIDNIEQFQKPNFLESEFFEEYCNLNNYEFDGTYKNLLDFSYTTTAKTQSGELITHTQQITFQAFRFQKFKSQIILLQKEIKRKIELKEKPYLKDIFLLLKNTQLLFKKDSEFNPYFDFLSSMIKDLKCIDQQLNSQITKNNSFKYKDGLKYDKIKSIYIILKREMLIDENTTYTDFAEIFQNKKIENLVTWTGTTSELKCFIQIINTSDYGFEDNDDEKWRIAVKCFSKIKKRSFDQINYKDLRTYKVTETTKYKMNLLIVERYFIR